VYLRRLGVNKAFISAGGVHPGRGASCSNFNEVPIKQAALASAGTAILVIDQSKLGQMKPAFFSPLKSFAHIIVGGTPAKAQRAKFRGLALEIVAS
jgi:DeoR family deoxyribose operon repressor